MNRPPVHSATSINKNTLLTFALLALIIFVAHFLNVLHFGLYEDDYFYISPNWNFPAFLDAAKSALLTWPQGRPIGFLLPPLLSFVGSQLGGLPAIYGLGFLILCLNTCLLYLFLRKVSTETIAITGALAYCLFPADTTHILLTHAFQLQTAMTFWLVGAHWYLAGRRILAYLAVTASLLSYESAFPVFLAIPLFRTTWDRALARELFRHALVLAGIMLAVVAIRLLMGEERVGNLPAEDLLTLPVTIAKSMIMGPAVSMLQFAYAPLRAQLYWSWQLTTLVAAPLAATLWLLRPPAQGSTPDDASPVAGGHLAIWQLSLTAALMLCLAYVFSFTHYPPVEFFGRGTSVHLASALGGSLLFACVWSQIIAFANRFRLRNIALVIFSLYVSALVGYRLLIQADFARAWDNQRSFWTSAVDLLPDITEGTVIFVVDKDLPQTQLILSYSWAYPLILAQLFEFPDHWENPPRLFVVPELWFMGLSMVTDDGPGAARDVGTPQARTRAAVAPGSGSGKHFEWMVPTATWDSHWEILPDGNVVLLEVENGTLVRRQGTMSIGGLDLNLKPLPPGAALSHQRGPLFDVLIGKPVITSGTTPQ